MFANANFTLKRLSEGFLFRVKLITLGIKIRKIQFEGDKVIVSGQL